MTQSTSVFPPTADGSASVTDSFSEFLTVTGGSGTGSLTLDYLLNGIGLEDGLETAAELSLTTNHGGFFNPSFICGTFECEWTTSGVPVAESFVVPFTFGTPVLFTGEYQIMTSETNGSASVIGSIANNGFKVIDANGNPVPGAVLQITSTPEPGTLYLLGGCLAVPGLRRVFHLIRM